MRQRPSTHLLILLSLFLLNGLAYLAIHRAGLERGFASSVPLALGQLALFLPLGAIFIWLARRGYRGDWTLLTVAILLFGVGQFMQYRLFTDPEYRGRGGNSEARKAREAKAETSRQRGINEFYDAEKKQSLFRDPNYQIPISEAQPEEPAPPSRPEVGAQTGLELMVKSVLKPLLALVGLILAIVLVGQDRILIVLQRNSFVIGLLTIIVFIPLLAFSSGGKFFGGTTPWEPVKVTFLASYAGILADHYRKLSQTRWGLPPWRFLLPLLLIAAMPVAAFLLLKDFGQLLVFLGVYLTLYLVAVRRLRQLTIAVIPVAVLLGISLLGVGIYSRVAKKTEQQEVNSQTLLTRMSELVSQGIPIRIHQRFHLWLKGSEPPDLQKDWWWRKSAIPDPENNQKRITIEDYLKQNQSDDPNSEQGKNRDLWYKSFAYQPLQALFGISGGRLVGKGLGRGYPESVPIADSDFIFAALTEEMGVLGGIVVLLGLLLLVIAGTRTAIEAPDMFTKLLAAGITAFLGFQAIVNIGGVIKMLPMTGITLPFVSHGGWARLTTFTMLGILMAISHRNRTIKEV